MLFLSRLCFRWRENVRVEQMPAAPGCHVAVLAAGKKLMCHRFILLVSYEKKECDSLVVPSDGRQFRRGISQLRPLLLFREVSRSERIIWPRAPACCENLVVAAE